MGTQDSTRKLAIWMQRDQKRSYLHRASVRGRYCRSLHASSRKLNLYTPAAMVGYFDELSATISRGETDEQELSRIALKYGRHVLGPVPEGYL